MLLSPERAGPYLRALQAGLYALAPHDVHVPLGEALAHLQALDPALSGGLLAPAELDPRSGMPAFTWLERAIAERALAVEGGAPSAVSEEELDRARRLDPELAERLAARNALHRFLRGSGLLPATRLHAALRRLGEHVDFVLTYDRIAPDGRWLRVSADVRGPPSYLGRGPFRRNERDGTVTADIGVQHLLTRHGLTPLLALHRSLAAALDAQVVRLSRGVVGPFLFPGSPSPEPAPECMAGALVLHLQHELVGEEVRAGLHRDPWAPPPDERVPEGQAVYRERRFAASPHAVAAIQQWCADRGAPTVVVALRPPPTGGRTL